MKSDSRTMLFACAVLVVGFASACRSGGVTREVLSSTVGGAAGDEITPATPIVQQSTRRGLPAPFPSPPYPSGEYQGYPLVGIPPSDAVWPLTSFLYERPGGAWLREKRIKTYGWLTGSANLSTAEDSNMPSSYWIDADSVHLKRQWVRRIASDPALSDAVAGFVERVHGFGATVCATGVEARREADTLRALGCDHAQGFLYCDPMEPDALGWLDD